MLLEWRLKQSRFKHQKKLNETNLYLYKSITVYIQNSDLRGNDKKEILQQVMDMMLQAQIEDKSVNFIIGHDYEQFCKSIIEEYNRDKNKTYRVLNYIQKYLLFMILISVFMVLLRRILNSSLYLGISIDQILTVGVISFIIIPATKKSRQETASLTLYQRLYINRGLTKSGAYAFTLTILTFGLLRLVLGKILNPEVFNYVITVYAGIPYVTLILVIIVAIEIYMKMYDLHEK